MLFTMYTDNPFNMTSSIMTSKEFRTFEYLEDEKGKIIQYISELKNDLIRSFLIQYNIPHTGNKDDLLKRINEAITIKKIQYSDLVKYLDNVILSGKQHVYLYEGSEKFFEKWQDNNYFDSLMIKNDLSELINSHIPIILPDKITLSSIIYNPNKELKIIAIHKRVSWERNSNYDDILNLDHYDIRKDAYVQNITRGIISFNWDFVMNQAIMQISQLPTKMSYESVEEIFNMLVGFWFPIDSFQKIELKPIISRLLKIERGNSPETRSHGFDLRTVGGRAVSIKSATNKESVFGEIDSSIDTIQNQSIGHSGNFYWLPLSINPKNNNCLEKELHTIINGDNNRINFTTPNHLKDINYVLSRVRALC